MMRGLYLALAYIAMYSAISGSKIQTALGFMSSANSRSFASSTSILITYPETIMPKDETNHSIDHRASMFGTSDFNLGAIQAEVVFDDKMKDSFCSISLMPTPGLNQVLLIDGSLHCYEYTSVVLHAQEKGSGFSGVFIMNSKCLKENANKLGEAWKNHCNSLGDTVDELDYIRGIDHRIAIPSFMISRFEGMRLRECWNEANGTKIDKPMFEEMKCGKDNFPFVELKWRIPQDDKLGWELYTSSLLNADLFVSEEWTRYVMPELVKFSNFTPRYLIFDGNKTKCTVHNPPPLCKDACHSSGRYCFPVPASLHQPALLGRNIVQESFRQHCAYSVNSATTKDELKWWNYVHLVGIKCAATSETFFFTEECSKKQHEEAGLDFEQTMKCINDAGGYEESGGENKIWENELVEIKNLNSNFVNLPMVIANGAILDFELNMRDVIAAFCSCFTVTTSVPFCECFKKTSERTDWEIATECFGVTPPPTPAPTPIPGSGVSYGLFFLIIVALVVAFVFSADYLKKKVRGQVTDDVRNIMGEYVQMDTEDSTSLPFQNNNRRGDFGEY